MPGGLPTLLPPDAELLLVHALELWDWFAAIGHADPLDALAADMDTLLSSGGDGAAHGGTH